MKKILLLMAFMSFGVVSAITYSYIVEGYKMAIVMLSAVICAVALTYLFAEWRMIGRPIPWENVPEDIPFLVKQAVGKNEYRVEFWPGGDRYIVGYSGLYVGRGWCVKHEGLVVSVKDPRPPAA
ncbi:MAG: hypothetical protein WC831_00910 [Parcubacteria group bacterium]|jgi:hypothetical protein